MPSLITTGGHLFEFRKFPSRFGTSSDNEIVIQEKLDVMPHHFTLLREGPSVVLETAGQGSTTVNGNAVRRTNIRDGDRIQVGQLMLIYSYPEAEPEADGEDPSIISTTEAFPEKPIPEAEPDPKPAASPSSPPMDEPEEDLAEIFFAAEAEDEPKTAPRPPVPLDVDIPAIPEISEAERSGATVTTSELPEKEIRPGVLRSKRPRPQAPPARTGLRPGHEAGAKSATAAAPHAGSSERSRVTRSQLEAGDTPPSPRERLPGAEPPDDVARRLVHNRARTKYAILIPWHKVAIFLCIFFAGAGAYLAKTGRYDVEQYLGIFGKTWHSEHGNYLRRLSTMSPAFLCTVDADRLVKIYRHWLEDEDWTTIGEIDDLIEDYASRFPLANLDRVSLAMNAEGRVLVLISGKSKWKNRALVRDLGRGMITAERVGEISVYEGFVSRREQVKFALLDPHTVAIGDPDMIMRFLLAPMNPPSGELLDQPGHALAASGNDWIGTYHEKGALDVLATILPEAIQPAAQRLFDFVRNGQALEGKVLARLGVDVRVDGDLIFENEEKARIFVQSWDGLVDERLKRLKTMLGPNAKSLKGARADLSRCVVEAEKDRVGVGLSVANRWATVSSDKVKSTVVHLLTAFQQPMPPMPTLMSPEELAAREAAREITQKYDRAVAAGARELEGVDDIETIVRKLGEGVRGAGAYHKVSYRVPQAGKLGGRVVELLAWGEGENQLVVTRGRRPGAGGEGEMLSRAGVGQDGELQEP